MTAEWVCHHYTGSGALQHPIAGPDAVLFSSHLVAAHPAGVAGTPPCTYEGTFRCLRGLVVCGMMSIVTCKQCSATSTSGAFWLQCHVLSVHELGMHALHIYSNNNNQSL
jgi:hypothetical protein